MDTQCVDLFSNALSGTGILNTPSNFTNALPVPLDLDHAEVAVKEISLPTSWGALKEPLETQRYRWVVVQKLPHRNCPMTNTTGEKYPGLTPSPLNKVLITIG